MQMKGRERAVPSRYRGYFSGPTENSYMRRSQIGVCSQRLSGRFLSRWIGELQTKFLSGSPTGGQAPQVDRQAPSCSHNEPSFASFTEQSVAQLLDRRVVRLPTYQAPDHFDEGVVPRQIVSWDSRENISWEERYLVTLFSGLWTDKLRKLSCGVLH